MNVFANIDLLTVGIMVAATTVLGFTIYFNNTKSVTNKIYLLFSLTVAIWGIVNYFAYQFSDPQITLWLIRLILFFATAQSFLLYTFFLVLPDDNYSFSRSYRYILLPLAGIVAMLTLTPLIFSNIVDQVASKSFGSIVKGPLWVIFAIFSAGLVVLALYTLLKKIKGANQNEKPIFHLILLGTIITYFFILTFNLTLPIIFNNTSFIPLGSLFIFPFIAFTSYAILKHGLFRLKVTETMLLIILLLAITFIQVIFSNSIGEIIFRSAVFGIVLLIGIFVIRITIREREVEEMKSEFISLATHHIGTPLTAVNGYISIVDEEYSHELSDKGREYLRIARHSVDNLIYIVKDFLDASSLDKGKVIYNFKETDVKSLLQTCINDNKERATQKGISFSFTSNPEANIYCSIDAEKFKQVFNNIIQNVLKHTSQGEIKVSILSKDDLLTISVIHPGVRDLPTTSTKLREKLSDIGSTFEADIIGNNLGLYVAKQIIEAHKGIFHIAKSEEGTRFSINLSKV
jgi:signal transduction histidine kinase